MSEDLDLEETAQSFTELANQLLDQEISGKIDPELSKELFEAAGNLVAASVDFLTDDMKAELKELEKVLVPSETSVESAQVLKEALAVISAAASIIAFIKGYRHYAGDFWRDRRLTCLLVMDEENTEFSIKLQNLRNQQPRE